MVPDLIVILDAETSTPINAERLHYGQRVAVLAIGAPASIKLRRHSLLPKPRCFGIDRVTALGYTMVSSSLARSGARKRPVHLRPVAARVRCLGIDMCRQFFASGVRGGAS